MSKQYGLIIPDSKKGAAKPILSFNSTKNVFGDNSDSDSDSKPKAPIHSGDKLKRQVLVAQQKAIEADPTVYLYDELYDEIENNKREKTLSKKVEKTPKYIHKLLEAADKRKKDNERRIERQVQKEREEEGDKFRDKESFVTSAYKKKLEEMRIEDEKDQREKYLEDIGDVTKQCDLGGFYRHLYDQQLKSKDVVIPPQVETKEIEPSEPECNNSKEAKSKRSYRKRKSSSNHNSDKSDSDEETPTKIPDIKTLKNQKTHLQSNIDADSDFSIDESSSDDENGVKKTKIDKAIVVAAEPIVEVKQEVEEAPTNADGEFKVPMSVSKVPVKEKSPEPEIVEEVKPKIDIWKKRTVGEVFEQALQRYYERKGNRGS